MSIIEINATLEHVEPAVIRTLQVPGTIRLDRLHLTLQAAFGWTNSHLYSFNAGELTWGLPDPEFSMDDLPADKTTLAQLSEETGASTIHYIYDFGDNWEHRLQIGDVIDPAPGDVYPRLKNISGRYPPEDVGGVIGYEEFLKAMTNPNHPEHEHLTEWHGEVFDPNTPPVDELRLEVLRLARRWKPKSKVTN